MTETVAAPPAACFAQGEDMTVLVTGKADPGYLGGVASAVAARLPGGRVIVAGDWDGVTLIHGDVRPTLIQALKDARDYHWDGLCGDREHLAWVEQYERALDVLERLPGLARGGSV